MLKKCKKCDKEFRTYASRIKVGKGKFCSRECSKTDGALKECEKCGDTFYVIASRAKKARFCSIKCTFKGKVGKTCKHCSKEFEVYPSQCDAIFCSRTCADIVRKGRTSPMKGKKNPSAARNPQVFNKGHVPWNKGKSHMIGEEHPNWKGGINLENERIRKSDEYKDWQQAVYKRDKWECQKCNKHGGDIVAHHIKMFSEFPELRFDVDNGVVLCRPCHARVHKLKDKNYLYV